MTQSEWAALDQGLQDELIQVAIETSAGWDHDAYASYELGVGCLAQAAPLIRDAPMAMVPKVVRFVALSQPIGA